MPVMAIGMSAYPFEHTTQDDWLVEGVGDLTPMSRLSMWHWYFRRMIDNFDAIRVFLAPVGCDCNWWLLKRHVIKSLMFYGSINKYEPPKYQMKLVSENLKILCKQTSDFIYHIVCVLSGLLPRLTITTSNLLVINTIMVRS